MARKAFELNPEDLLSLNLIEMACDKLSLKLEADQARLKLIEIIPSYLSKNPEDARARMLYATSSARLGQFEKAKEIGKKTIEMNPTDSLLQYYAACLYVAIGEFEMAVEAITRSVQNGWKDIEWIKNDPDLDAIRNHPGYIELMKDK